MARKEHTDASVARSGEDFEDLPCDLLRFFDLTQNSNLHIVDEQGDPLRITQLFELLRYIESKGAFHSLQELALTLGDVFHD